MEVLSITGPDVCAYCGGPLDRWNAATGRPRVYCSDYCRKAAWDVRRKPGAVAIQVKVVERVVVKEHNLAECSRRCCQSPVAATNLLRELTHLAEAGVLSRNPKWERARTACQTLAWAMGYGVGGR